MGIILPSLVELSSPPSIPQLLILLSLKMVATTVAPTSAVSAPVGSSKDGSSVHSEAMEHLLEGKRNYLCGEFAEAVSCLALACELMTQQYGETADECADSYFHYGKALLELARMESGVLGNALEGVPEGDDAEDAQVESAEKMSEDEKEDVGTKVMEALEENFVEHEEKVATLLEGHIKAVDCDEEEGDEDEDSMDVDEKKLCETLLALGEVSIENESWTQAVDDLKECLEKRKALGSYARLIAETHFQLGVAQCYHMKFDEAVQSFNDAKTILSAHLESLKADTFNAKVSEIDELEMLLPEIDEKILDTHEMKAHPEKMKEMAGFSKSSMAGKSANVIETKKK